MSSTVPNRRSFGNRSTKSTSSKRAVSRCFWMPTISSQLKIRQAGMLKGEEGEVESLTDTVGKTSTISRRKSPAPSKVVAKSPIKPVSRFKENILAKRASPAIKPRLQRYPRNPVKSVKENVVKKEPVIKAPEIKSVAPASTSSRKLNYSVKPKEPVKCKFEIPNNLKRRDSKALEIKAEKEKEKENEKQPSKEFADITNHNFDALSSTTPMRCETGKSSVVRSNISLLQSLPGSAKSTPNITPYKMMRRNKEGGKDGAHDISDLENKIRELEEQIMQSKKIRVDDDDNEFLDGMSQIDGNKLVQENRKPDVEPSPVKFDPVEELPEAENQPPSEEPSPVKPPVEEEKALPKDENDEPDEIKELEAMLGQVFSTLQKDKKLPNILQDKIKAYENLTSDLLKSVKGQGADEVVKTPANRHSESAKSKKSAQKPKSRQVKRRRSSRNRRRYNCIDLYYDSS